MKTAGVNTSFQKDLPVHIDDVAKEESRSRPELIREEGPIIPEGL